MPRWTSSRKRLGGASFDDVVIDVAFDFRHVAERHDGKHLRRNQEIVVAGIVGRTEARPDHPGVADRPALAVVGELFVRVARVARMILLALHRRERRIQHLSEIVVEDARIAGRLPIAPRERHRIGQRVELELLLPHAIVERVRVRVRIDLHVLGHARDDAAQQRANVGIVLGEKQIRARLRAGVAQPLGRNVASFDVRRPVRRHDRELARVEQRGAEHILQLGVRISIVGGGLLDRVQFQRRGFRRRESDRGRAKQRERSQKATRHAGHVPCA